MTDAIATEAIAPLARALRGSVRRPVAAEAPNYPKPVTALEVCAILERAG
jgi:hypothetical protein